MANDDKKKDESFDKELVSLPNTRIPKYCTSVIVAKRSDGNIILTFLYTDTPKDKEAVVIERIIIDGEHAGKIANAIKGAIEKDK